MRRVMTSQRLHFTSSENRPAWLRLHFGRLCAAFSCAVLLNFVPAQSSAQSIAIGAFALPTPNCSPAEITRGPDGALWFSEQGCNQIGRITTNGAITEYRLPPCTNNCNLYPPGGPSPTGIVSGPDGALWFAETGANAIGRITTSGAVTVYPITPPDLNHYSNHVPNSITVGADGALWFGEGAGPVIGRITTAGVVTEYNLCTISTSPSCDATIFGDDALATGPDGNLWFAGLVINGSIAGSLSPALQFAAYSLGGISADGITVGPGGNLWVIGNGGCGLRGGMGQYVISKVTTSGSVTAYPQTYSCTSANEITVGPDGAIWYALTVGAIGRITTSGSVTVYPVAASPGGITAGPDGNVWFTDPAGDEIWRVIPNSSGTPRSQVLPFPASESSPNFAVQWSAPATFGGVKGWSIFVSDNGGPFTLWLNAVGFVNQWYFSGQLGHRYGFYSLVTYDGLGTPESPKSVADATAVVPLGIPGDVDGDGFINCADIDLIKASFGEHTGETGFNPAADLNHDGIVNVLDLAIATQKLIPNSSCH